MLTVLRERQDGATPVPRGRRGETLPKPRRRTPSKPAAVQAEAVRLPRQKEAVR